MTRMKTLFVYIYVDETTKISHSSVFLKRCSSIRILLLELSVTNCLSAICLESITMLHVVIHSIVLNAQDHFEIVAR